MAKTFIFRDRRGKTYVWEYEVLSDTIFEGEAWGKPSVKKRVRAMKAGQTITVGGEKLTRTSPTRNYAPPRKKVRIKATRPGKLGGPGYLSRTDATRHKILRGCVRKYGYRSCLGSIQALEVWGKNTLSTAHKGKLVRDRLFLRKTFGGPGSGTRNPSRDRKVEILEYLNTASRRAKD